MISIYNIAISTGNTIGPLICGFVVSSLGWRYHKWIAFALTMANWIVVVFFVPETRYDRSHKSDGLSTPSSSSEPDVDGEKAVKPKAHSNSEADEGVTPEELKNLGMQQAQLPKKSWLQELSLWSGVPENTSLLKLFIRPLSLVVLPAVILASLQFAVSLAWLVAINLLNPFVLQAPPYNWRPEINGLINISGLIGNLVGAWLGGWVVDRYSDWRSKKNGGVFQPETRLHLLVIPGLIVPAGCLVFGYGVAESLHWTAL